MTLNRTSAGPQVIRIFRVMSDWGEAGSDASANEGRGASAEPGDVTWLHTFSPEQMWSTPGGDFAAAQSAQAPAGSSGAVTWGSTSEMVADVQAWVDNPSQSFGWVLMGTESNDRTSKRFASREHDDESARPTLVVQFTPPS